MSMERDSPTNMVDSLTLSREEAQAAASTDAVPALPAISAAADAGRQMVQILYNGGTAVETPPPANIGSDTSGNDRSEKAEEEVHVAFSEAVLAAEGKFEDADRALSRAQQYSKALNAVALILLCATAFPASIFGEVSGSSSSVSATSARFCVWPLHTRHCSQTIHADGGVSHPARRTWRCATMFYDGSSSSGAARSGSSCYSQSSSAIASFSSSCRCPVSPLRGQSLSWYWAPPASRPRR